MQKPFILPYPVKVEPLDGVTKLDKLVLKGDKCAETDFFIKHAAAAGIDIGNGGEATIVEYCIDIDSAIPREGYDINLKGTVKIVAKDGSGLLYAFVTLLNIASAYGGQAPSMAITDYPDTEYRGMLLDVSRYFFPKEDIYRFADFMALHKLNALHLHLTDDQGWRIKIDKYPLLTDKGSYRTHTNFGCRPHGGYYSKGDIQDIVSYCNALHIEVIPEIDMPGHTRSALAAYPELGCFGRELTVATHSGVKHDILCAGKESTYVFVRDVIDEVIDMFGAQTRYIHIGGDEIFKHRWGICPDCLNKIKEENLGDVEGLQRYFVRRIAAYIADRGYIPLTWSEALSGEDNPAYASEYWANTDTVGVDDFAKAANEVGKIINTDSGYCYVDLPYSYISLRKAYSFKPDPTGKNGNRTAGGEISLWTEYVPDFRVAMRRLMPRAEALAEAMWRVGEKDYEDFIVRLQYMTELLNKCGYVGIPPRRANPNKLRGLFQTIWFERRQLHWEGLHNLLDDASVARRYRKK